jgi:hypothetical protein
VLKILIGLIDYRFKGRLKFSYKYLFKFENLIILQ